MFIYLKQESSNLVPPRAPYDVCIFIHYLCIIIYKHLWAKEKPPYLLSTGVYVCIGQEGLGLIDVGMVKLVVILSLFINKRFIQI